MLVVNLSVLNSPPQRICAIDASTNSLAFAIFEDKKLDLIGKINFEGSNTYDKVADACAKTESVFGLYQVEAIVIEHTVFMNSPKTQADLALVQGGLLGGMSLAGARKIKSTNPIAWQTFIGNGRLTHAEKAVLRTSSPGKSDSWYKTKEREIRKQKTISFVNTYYDKKISDNDIADAVGIGHYAIRNWAKLN
jgi:Holliday junction resolvasome RuvABC endonuclease subunit